MRGMARIQEVVGRRIKDARDENGWTQVQLGRELEPFLGQAWSSQVMAQAESGGRAFTVAELVALALVLEKEIGWFIRPTSEVESVELPRRKRLPRDQGGGFEDLPPAVVSWVDLVNIAAAGVGVAESEANFLRLAAEAEESYRRLNELVAQAKRRVSEERQRLEEKESETKPAAEGGK